MRILVVEDDADWREALAMMYCRRLREVNLEKKAIPDDCKKCAVAKDCIGLEPEKNAGFEQREKHVMTAADANQAIAELQVSREDLKSGKRKIDLISLDLDIPKAGTGIDILKHATSGNRRVAVLGISSFRNNKAFKERLSTAEREKLWNLRRLLEQTSGGRCEVIEKSNIDTISEQIISIEKNWTKSNLMRLVRETDDRYENVDTADHLCLHFVLPNAVLPDGFPDYVRIYSTKNGRFEIGNCKNVKVLDQISIWSHFSPCKDNEDMRFRLGARLTYLAAHTDIQMFCSLQKADNADRPDQVRSLIDWKGKKRQMLLARLIAHRIVYDTGNLQDDRSLLLNTEEQSVVKLLGNKWYNDGHIDIIKEKNDEGVVEKVFIDISPRTVRQQGYNNRLNVNRTDDPRNLIGVREFLASLTPNREDLVATINGEFRLKLKATVFLQRSSAIGQDTRPARTRTLRDDET